MMMMMMIIMVFAPPYVSRRYPVRDAVAADAAAVQSGFPKTRQSENGLHDVVRVDGFKNWSKNGFHGRRQSRGQNRESKTVRIGMKTWRKPFLGSSLSH